MQRSLASRNCLLQKFKGCFDQIWLPVMRMAFIHNQSPLQHLIAQNFKVVAN